MKQKLKMIIPTIIIYALLYILFSLSTFVTNTISSPSPKLLPPISLSLSETKIKVNAYLSFDSYSLKRMIKIISKTESVINSNDFKLSILENKTFDKFIFLKNNNLSNKEIYELIMSGKESGTKKDETWNFSLAIKKILSNSVTAYTTTGTDIIYLSKSKFSTRSDDQISGTICHEYAHKLGFNHSKKNHTLRKYSVPYRVGDICSEIYLKMFSSKNMTKKLNYSCGLWCKFKKLF